MTTLEDGFWEQAIGEAAGGRKPPAQTDVILTRLQIPDLGPPPVEEKPKGRLLRLRHLFEAAAAVAALLAIGVLTGLIPLGGGNAGNGAGGGEDGPGN